MRRGLVYGCACGGAAVAQVGGSTPLDAASVNACMRRNEGVGCDLLTYRDARGHESATEEYEYACEAPAFKDLADCLEVGIRARARVTVRGRRDCLEVRLGFGLGHGLRLGSGLGGLS